MLVCKKCGLETNASGRNMFCFRNDCPKARATSCELRERNIGDAGLLAKKREEEKNK